MRVFAVAAIALVYNRAGPAQPLERGGVEADPAAAVHLRARRDATVLGKPPVEGLQGLFPGVGPLDPVGVPAGQGLEEAQLVRLEGLLFAGEVLREKISKIASYFGAGLYKYPELSTDHAEMMAEVDRRIAESSEVMARGNDVMRDILITVAATYPTWNFVVAKEKMSYDALNMCEFDIKRHVFIAEMWVPTAKFAEVESGVRAAARARRRRRGRWRADRQGGSGNHGIDDVLPSGGVGIR